MTALLQTYQRILGAGQTTASILVSLQYFLIVISIDTSLNLSFILVQEKSGSNSSTHNDSFITYTSTETPMDIFIIILLSLSLAGLFYFSCGCCSKKAGWCATTEENSPQSGSYLQYGMAIFGFVAVVWYVATIFQCATSFEKNSRNQTKCNSSLGTRDEKTNPSGSILYSSLHALFVLGETYFVYIHSRSRFVKGWTMRFFLLHLLATNYGLWFRTSVNEAHERSLRLNDTCKKTAEHYLCFSENHRVQSLMYETAANSTSEFDQIVDSAEPFVYPSIAEFCLSASAIVFNMWLFMKNDDEKEVKEKGKTAHCRSSVNQVKETEAAEETAAKETQVKESQAEGSPLLPNGEEENRTQSRVCIRLPMALFTAFLPATMILSIACIVIDSKKNDSLPVTFYVAVQLVTSSLCIIFSIIGLILLLRRRDDSVVSTHVLIESALLLIALLGTYIAQALQLAATVNTHPNNIPKCQKLITIYSTNSGLYLVLGFFQSFFIIGGLQSRNVNRRNQTNNQDTTRPLKTRLLRLITLILLLCNVNLWISRTYEMSGLHCNALFTTFYKNTNWAFLSDVFYPLWIFFHFHSAASCWDILKGL